MCIYRVFEEYCNMVKYSYPAWLPRSFRIFPKTRRQTSIRNKLSIPLPEKPDDRVPLQEACDRLVKEGGKPPVWIAKSSTGAKGKCIEKSLSK